MKRDCSLTILQKVLVSYIGSLEIDVVKAGHSEPGITEIQLGMMLGSDDPDQHVKRIRLRNPERFDDGTKCTVLKIQAADGKFYDTHVYPFKGVLEVCRFSTLPNATAVMDWAWETLDRLRTGTLPTATLDYLSRRLESVEDELFAARKIIDFHENSDDVFDFDYVAAAISKYMKPPFGVKHLCQWLENRGVLTRMSYKNSRPMQIYINKGWFEPRNHTWRQRGRCRHTQTYWFTARGLNAIIRMAIAEKMLLLPAASQTIFPVLSVVNERRDAT
jgi:phage antirepressor YoqD-like protein